MTNRSHVFSRKPRLLGLALSAALLPLCAQAQNLLPNPGFENGATQPTGWQLTDAQGGEWREPSWQGKRALSVRGDGRASTAWRTALLPLQPAGLYRLRFMARREPGASGGCAVSGTGRVNRDFRLSDQWAPCSFVFAVPSGVSNDYVRLGHWEVKGALSFDDAELLPVLAAHDPYEEMGEAESIRNGVYHFQPDFGWTGANYHRPLWLNKAGFNSERWVFSAGSELIYRFAMPRRLAQTGARLRVNVNYHVAGSLRIEASRDAQTWTPVAEYDGQRRGGQTNLPAALFPAKEIYVRLSVPEPGGNLQVNAIDYEAQLEGARFSAEGNTQFFEVLASHPDLAVTLHPSHPERSAVDAGISGSLSNCGQSRLTFTQVIQSGALQARARTANVLEPGKWAGFNAALPVPEPGRYPLTLRFDDPKGQPVFAVRTEENLSLLRDPRPGYWLAGEGRRQVWWCESGWKIGSRELPPTSHVRTNHRPVTVSAARGEYEAVQIHLCGFGDKTLKAAAIEGLRNQRGETPPVEVSFCEIVPVHVTRPTDESYVRGYYPDPLPPLALPRPGLPSFLSLWITFQVGRDAKAGEYRGDLVLVVENETLKLPVSLRVHDFALPRESHLRSALGLGADEINRYHKLSSPSDRMEVYEKYLRNFAEHRISPYSFFDYSGIEVRFEGQGADKRARVDFAKFDKAAERWLDQGGFNSFSLPLRGMGGGTFHSRHLGQLEGFKEGTPEFARLFRDYLGQVGDHLRARGWLDKAYTYWFDEPDPKDYEFVVEGMKRIRAAAPGLKRMLTEQPEKELQGHVEIWCGLTPEWTPEKVAARRAAGEEVWWYICCAPKAPYVTEFIDHPGLEPRLWPWQSWQYGVQGILVWATIYWSSSSAFPDRLQNPWADPMSYVSGYDFKAGQIGYWGNGDGRFLYPPRRDPNTAREPCLDAPINSVRWENLRDGMEDYEYFWLLDQAVQRAAGQGAPAALLDQARALLKVPERVSKDLTHFTTDPRPLLEHRDKLARMIERLGAP